MYCNSCGTEINESDKFCKSCGNSISSIPEKSDEVAKSSTSDIPSEIKTETTHDIGQVNISGLNNGRLINGKYIGGIVLLFVGIIGLILSILKISDDKNGYFWYSYDYHAPLSTHETIMVFAVIASSCVILAGFILFIKGKFSNQ